MATAYDTALAAGAPRVGVFFRLEVDPVFRFWLGIGDCQAGIDATDGAGASYSGLGQMVGLPALQQLVNGAADRVEFKLSYVSQRVAALASAEHSDVKGASFRVGLGLFDAQWQLIQQPQWLKSFVIDFLSIERDQTQGEAVWTLTQGEAVWTLSLSARSLFTGRRRPGLGFWTDADQQARHSGDKFCQRSVLYSVDVQKAWPKL